jgi:hypothetical protein
VKASAKSFCAVFLFAVVILALVTKGQEDKSKRPSPPAHTEFTFPDGKTITVDYSSPRMNGRKIFGDLEPYGKVWRAGANEATTFVTNTNLVVGGKDVPAGEYTLDMIPDQDAWTLIVSKKTKNAKGGPLWGIPYPGEQYDLMRTSMKLMKLDSPVEDMLIGFNKSDGGCVLHLDWETSSASVEISEKK